jgi:hypothetical protein
MDGLVLLFPAFKKMGASKKKHSFFPAKQFFSVFFSLKRKNCLKKSIAFFKGWEKKPGS